MEDGGGLALITNLEPFTVEDNPDARCFGVEVSGGWIGKGRRNHAYMAEFQFFAHLVTEGSTDGRSVERVVANNCGILKRREENVD